MKKVILIGAGGHSKSVADAINTNEMELYGFVDEHKTGMHYGKPILGNKIENIPDFQSYYYLVAIGDVYARELWFNKILNMNLNTINIIDQTAVLARTAKIGTGNFIGKYAVINADSVIGDNNVINTKALVEHECMVGSHNHLSTNSVINGNVILEDRVFLGSSSVSNGQLHIGHDSIIGSGSVVIRDVESYTTVVGVPAFVIKRRKYEQD